MSDVVKTKRKSEDASCSCRWQQQVRRRERHLCSQILITSIMYELPHALPSLSMFKEYKSAVIELQSLSSRCKFEVQRRETVEATCSSLRIEKDRVIKMYHETMTKLATQVGNRAKWQKLKEDLKKIEEEHVMVEKENDKRIAEVTQDSAMRIRELENQIRFLEEVNYQQQQDLATRKSQIDLLSMKLEQVNTNVELKYHNEIQDLRDWLLVEQEEKQKLMRKLHSSEQELTICKRKQAEQERDSTSNFLVETLKMKIMKLRKENEILRKQLDACTS